MNDPQTTVRLVRPGSSSRRLFVAALAAAWVAAALPAAVPNATAQPRPRDSRAARPERPELAGLAVPPGSRPARSTPGAYRSGRNLRQTVDFYKRLFKQRGHEFREIPTYERRGVLVTRLLSRSPQARWTAVHVWKSGSRTWIAIVPRSDLTSAQRFGT